MVDGNNPFEAKAEPVAAAQAAQAPEAIDTQLDTSLKAEAENVVPFERAEVSGSVAVETDFADLSQATFSASFDNTVVDAKEVDFRRLQAFAVGSAGTDPALERTPDQEEFWQTYVYGPVAEAAKAFIQEKLGSTIEVALEKLDQNLEVKDLYAVSERITATYSDPLERAIAFKAEPAVKVPDSLKNLAHADITKVYTAQSERLALRANDARLSPAIDLATAA